MFAPEPTSADYANANASDALRKSRDLERRVEILEGIIDNLLTGKLTLPKQRNE